MPYIDKGHITYNFRDPDDVDELRDELDAEGPPLRNGDDYADYGGVLGADGQVYSDADPGL